MLYSECYAWLEKKKDTIFYMHMQCVLWEHESIENQSKIFK